MLKPSEVSSYATSELKKLRRQLMFLYVISLGRKRILLGERIDLVSMELDHRLGSKKYKA